MFKTKVIDLFEINNFVSYHFWNLVCFGGKIEVLIFMKTFLMNK